MHKKNPIVLASGSHIRATLLQNAGVAFSTTVARIDEQSVKESLQAEGAPPRDIADQLAEAKARKVSQKAPDAFVIGSDQVLSFKGSLLSKPVSQGQAVSDLSSMCGQTHHLFSAAVIYHDAKPIWRHIGEVRMTMRRVSNDYLEAYVERNWDSIRQSVGAYKLEEEGIRLFQNIQGDYFHVLGFPLLEILAFLTVRGVIEG